ncbi:MAG: transglycosylase SLT domain-containing protein [Deltaproteobacteria bacterium]|nr:transglycosylase SLT domain-containing protein [Deltaproteobacteria bacterium]MCB9478227.1 transglycosylase SLT domain-containing protein [Deltaproteobacteria bacterium]MCB9487220.1 transglycosylase SLT domain-containing protein [Deltaproteobacteria bacterium]
MRLLRVFALLALAVSAIYVSGCAVQTSPDRISAQVPTDSDLVEEALSGETLTPEQAYRSVNALLRDGEEAAETAQYEKAKTAYEDALHILLTKVDTVSADYADWQLRLEQLLVKTCLANVRLARLRGLEIPAERRPSDLNIVYNTRVEPWLNYYLTRGRSSMATYLERMGAYEHVFEQVLEEKNLPSDLKYLPIIESGVSPFAYSHAAAGGLWQFIPGTGQRYGLQINRWVDERRDPEKATRAAAEYLSTLHEMFGDWALALAAYNCGENRVASVINSQGTRNFWEMTLPTETMNYVPKFIAAMMIAREPEAYGFYVEPQTPVYTERISLDGVVKVTDLAAQTGLDYDELKRLNPELLGSITPPSENQYAINVPAQQAEPFREKLASINGGLYLSEAQVKNIVAPPKPKPRYVYYKVKRGNTLGGIAGKYRTSVTLIKRLNGIKGNTIRIGQTLKIKPGHKR